MRLRSTVVALLALPLSFTELLAKAAWVVRRVIGAPDYAAYVAHVRRAHPGSTPLAPEAFALEAHARRYDRPGSRCC